MAIWSYLKRITVNSSNVWDTTATFYNGCYHHLPIRNTWVQPSFLVWWVVFCTSLFVHFSYFNLTIVLFIHGFSAFDYPFGIFTLFLSSFKLFLQHMADSRQNHCLLISIWLTVALVPLLVGFFRNRVVPLLFSSPVVETASVV